MKKKIVQFGSILLLSLCFGAMTVFAQTATVRPNIVPQEFITGNEEGLLIPNAARENVPQEQFFGGRLLPTLTNTIIALAGGLAFVFMIVGGIQILTAYGNEERVSAGKKTMTYAIVGLLIAILSYAVVSIISGVRLTGTPQQGGQTETTTESTNET